MVLLTAAFVAVAAAIGAYAPARRLAALGAMAGALFALWVILPMVFDLYRIYTLGAGAVLLVVLPLTLAHAIAGFVLLGTMAFVQTAPWRRHRRPPAGGVWPLALAFGALPLFYAGAAVLVHGLNTAQPPVSEVGWRALGLGVLGYVVCGVASIWYVSRQTTRSRARLAVRRVAVFGMMAGLATIGLRLPDEPAGATRAPVVLGAASTSPVRPLLVVGLDGADWRVLDAAIDAGAAPTLAHLKATGTSGVVKAGSPPYWSSPSWASIVTGYDERQHGIHQNLQLTIFHVVPAQLALAPSPILSLVNVGVWRTVLSGWSEPAFFARAQLRAPPVWEHLAQANLTVGVVRFPFTYPADGAAGMMVADRITTNSWELLGVLPGARTGVVWPPALADRVLQIFQSRTTPHTSAIDVALQGTEGPAPAGGTFDPRAVTRAEVASTAQAFDAAGEFLRHDDSVDALFVYVGGLDTVGHVTWQYAFPGDFPGSALPAEEMVRMSGLLWRYVTHVDTRLGALIRAFPTPPNVLIVSDHGMRSVPDHAVWTAWHSPDGLFIAAGPDVAPVAAPSTLRQVDIVPLIFDILGLGR